MEIRYYLLRLNVRHFEQSIVEGESVEEAMTVVFEAESTEIIPAEVIEKKPFFSAFSDLDLIRVWDVIVLFMKENRQELVSKAEFNRWRTDFTLITRLILANNKEADKTYKSDLALWRKGLKEHWKMLIAPHAMPKSREVLVFNLRFLYRPTRLAMRLLGGKRKR